MSDSDKKETDPTENPKFKRVVEHFLKTPPKPHKPLSGDEPKEKAKKE